MKQIVIAFLVFMCSSVQAQLVVKEFFTKDGKPTDESSSYYYQVGEKVIYESYIMGIAKRDTLYADTVKTFYSGSDKLRSRIFYEEGMKHGSFTFFYEGGRTKEIGRFSKDRKLGYVTSWYENGVVEKTLKYFVDESKFAMKDSFQIVNYRDASGQLIVENGKGYCSCRLSGDDLVERGKVVNGYRDSTWQFFINDTLKYEEEFDMNRFVKGKSYYNGTEIAYTKREVQAEMPGGLPALMEFLRKNIRYPVEAKRMGVQGRVFIKFIVDKNGNIIDPEVTKGVHKSLDQEALRVVRLLKKWTPGKLRGVPVKSQFVIPINFALDR